MYRRRKVLTVLIVQVQQRFVVWDYIPQLEALERRSQTIKRNLICITKFEILRSVSRNLCNMTTKIVTKVTCDYGFDVVVINPLFARFSCHLAPERMQQNELQKESRCKMLNNLVQWIIPLWQQMQLFVCIYEKKLFAMSSGFACNLLKHF